MYTIRYKRKVSHALKSCVHAVSLKT